MAKKPHIDFTSRAILDGSEELYTQSALWENPEQKFTLAQLATFILNQVPAPGETNTASNSESSGIGVFDNKSGVDLQFRNIAAKSNRITVELNGKNIEIDVVPSELNIPDNLADLSDINSPTNSDVILHWNGTTYDWIPTPAGGGGGASASNGLTLNTDYELGGTLTKTTSINTGNFEFDMSKLTVGMKAYNQNPVWTPGDESFFLTGKNLTRDTENFMGVTDHSSTGGIIQMYTRKPIDGTTTFFFQVPTQTTIQSEKKPENDRTTLQLSYYGMFLTAFEGGNFNEGGLLSVDKEWSEFRRKHAGSELNLRYQKKSTSSNNLEVLFQGLPTYNDVAAAQADNYPSEGIFKTPSGEIKIVP